MDVGKMEKLGNVEPILVLGGTGFMSAQLLRSYLQREEKPMHNRHVYFLCRGNWDWDDANDILPHFTFIKFDRRRDDIDQVLSKANITSKLFSFVIDFSCYKEEVCQRIIPFIRRRCLLYIFISTDSVYDMITEDEIDVLKGKRRKENGKKMWEIEEKDLNHQQVMEKRRKSVQEKDYSMQKFLCENLIIKEFSRSTVGHYLIFRLPDVVGARDGTHRWWIYQLLMQYSNYPLAVYNHNPITSFVYHMDVSNIILHIINYYSTENNRKLYGHLIQDQIFNLATENLSLDQLLYSMAQYLNVDELLLRKQSYVKAVTGYPSIEFNGSMSVEKVKRMLTVEFSRWEDVVKETVDFFEASQHDDNFLAVIDEILTDNWLPGKEDKKYFLQQLLDRKMNLTNKMRSKLKELMTELDKSKRRKSRQEL
ncbi:hypothetical protein SNEBB_009454 [Seison nebaliae]|nr:hypothetical protein SNEBB_009454 [Seison nebaliae]